MFFQDQALKESLHEHGVKVSLPASKFEHLDNLHPVNINPSDQVLSGVDEVLSNLDQPSLCFSLIRSEAQNAFSLLYSYLRFDHLLVQLSKMFGLLLAFIFFQKYFQTVQT